ncbi:glycosyltransferase family 2 protein [Patescibacteria group bacterium]|nr:MAG: glycosyltransferase family 2 protein [Patescibacteria group bacterium]
MEPEISVIIVSWNVRELLRRAIASLERFADVPFELFVIDNASLDGTREFLAAGVSLDNPLCVRVRVIQNNRGRGFARATNQGLSESRAPYALLFAPDAELHPRALSALLQAARRAPNIGVVGGQILNADGSLQTSIANLPTVWTHIGGRLRLHKLFPASERLQRSLHPVFDYGREAGVPSVKGALFLITPLAKTKVGLLDERFFIWFEETDYCARAAAAGLAVRYAPAAVATHIGLASMKKMSFWSRQTIWNASLRKYFSKHYGLAAGLTLALLDPLLVALGLLLAKLAPARGRRQN